MPCRPPERFCSVDRVGRRISLREVIGPRSIRLPGPNGSNTLGHGSFSPVGAPSRARSFWTFGSDLRVPSRGTPPPESLRVRLWRSAVLLPLPPSRGGGWRVQPRSSEISRTARPLRSLANPSRGTPRDGALVLRWRFGSRGSSRSRPLPSLPHRPRTATRAAPAGSRVFLHRRVQWNPVVCCNVRVHCSFLGFCSPSRRWSRSRDGRARALSSSTAGLPVVHPGPDSRDATARSRIAPRSCRTTGRFRLFGAVL